MCPGKIAAAHAAHASHPRSPRLAWLPRPPCRLRRYSPAVSTADRAWPTSRGQAPAWSKTTRGAPTLWGRVRRQWPSENWCHRTAAAEDFPPPPREFSTLEHGRRSGRSDRCSQAQSGSRSRVARHSPHKSSPAFPAPRRLRVRRITGKTDEPVPRSRRCGYQQLLCYCLLGSICGGKGWWVYSMIDLHSDPGQQQTCSYFKLPKPSLYFRDAPALQPPVVSVVSLGERGAAPFISSSPSSAARRR